MALAALAAASCFGDDDDQITATSSPAAEVEASQLPAHGEAIEPGWYTHEPFTPPVAVQVGEGWSAGHLNQEFWDVQRPNLLLGFARPDFLIDENGEEVSVESMDAREALELLAANAQLDPGELGESVVAGNDAVVLELLPEASTEILGGPSGRLMLEAGKPVRVIGLDVDGAPLFVVFLSLDETTDGFEVAEEAVRTVRVG